MATSYDQFRFYPGFWLVRDGDYVALENEQDAVRLDKTNAPFYALGEAGALLLTPDTILPYVRFFFDNVVASHCPGQFIVVEPGDEFPWLAGIDQSVIDNILPLVKPMELAGLDAQGLLTVRLTFMFHTALFSGDAKVAPKDMLVYDQTKEADGSGNFRQDRWPMGRIALWNEVVLCDAVPVVEELWKRGVLP